MHSLIIQAINEKRLIALNYDPGDRIIKPCAYGTGSDRQGLLRAFQTSGASASDEHVDWKLFRTDRIRSIKILTQTFASPPLGYKRGDRAMTTGIYAQL